jgi:predicted dehydrogenase
MTKQIKLAVTGTSWIAEQFIKGAIENGKYKLRGVHGRTDESAKRFLDKMREYAAKEVGGEKGEKGICKNAIWTNDADKIAEASVDRIDTVYIATPNSMHYEQAIKFLKAGKNVIVEKPFFATTAQYLEAKQIADEKGLFVVEALRTIWDENFSILKSKIQSLESITGAMLFDKNYSSKYNRFLKGDIAPVFTLEAQGGALQDFGTYVLYTAVDFFGMPVSARYFADKLKTGVDGQGVIILKYDGFTVSIGISKVQQTYQSSEFYGVGQTIVVNDIALVNSIRVYDTTRDKTMGFHDDDGDESEPYDELGKPRLNANPLADEIEAFAQMILGDEAGLEYTYDEMSKLAADVLSLTETLRKDADIDFGG